MVFIESVTNKGIHIECKNGWLNVIFVPAGVKLRSQYYQVVSSRISSALFHFCYIIMLVNFLTDSTSYLHSPFSCKPGAGVHSSKWRMVWGFLTFSLPPQRGCWEFISVLQPQASSLCQVSHSSAKKSLENWREVTIIQSYLPQSSGHKHIHTNKYQLLSIWGPNKGIAAVLHQNE